MKVCGRELPDPLVRRIASGAWPPPARSLLLEGVVVADPATMLGYSLDQMEEATTGLVKAAASPRKAALLGLTSEPGTDLLNVNSVVVIAGSLADDLWVLDYSKEVSTPMVLAASWGGSHMVYETLTEDFDQLASLLDKRSS